jgi:hypothetical protein
MDTFDQEKRPQEGMPEEVAPLASQGHDPPHASAAQRAQAGGGPHARRRL